MSETTEQPKWIGTSMTLWGLLVVAGSSILPMVGVAIDANEVNTLQTSGSQLIQAVSTMGGLIMAIIGRYRAGGVTMTPGAGA